MAKHRCGAVSALVRRQSPETALPYPLESAVLFAQPNLEFPGRRARCQSGLWPGGRWRSHFSRPRTCRRSIPALVLRRPEISRDGIHPTRKLSGFTAIVFPKGFRDPYVENWFLGIQRELRPKLTIELNYVGTAGRNLFRAENVNRVPGGRLPEGTCVTDNFGRHLCSQINTHEAANGRLINPQGRLNPNYGRLRVWENAGSSIYHAMQVSVRKQLSHGLQFSGNYTYSHSIDSGSTWQSVGTTVNGPAAGDGLTTDQTQPGLDRGNSVFDIRHRLTFTYIWEMPFFRNNHGMLAALLGGWQWNGIWSFQSGAHWSPFDPIVRPRCRVIAAPLHL